MAKKKTKTKSKSTGVNVNKPLQEVTISKADNGLVVSSLDKKFNRRTSVAKNLDEAMVIAKKKLKL